MKFVLKSGSLLLSISVAAVLLPTARLSYAQLGQNLSIDIQTLSMGNAVTADPPGVNSIHFNPAGLTQVQGLQTDVNSLLADFKIRREFTAPKGYNVFGYSDDPLICATASANDDNRLCEEFKPYAVSKIAGAALYLPVLDDILELPEKLPLAAATAGVAYRPPGSKAVYGTSIYAPLVAGYYQNDDDPGNYMGQAVAMERITYLSPTIAYEVDDNLSVGASVGMSYQAIAMDTDLRFPNTLIGVGRLIDEEICAPFKGDANIVTDILLLGICNAEESLGPFKSIGAMSLAVDQTASPSFNVGVLWEPTDDLAFGMVYQSEAKMQLTGEYEVENGKGAQELIRAMNGSITGQIVVALLGFPSYVPPVETGRVSMELVHPKHFQVGMKYNVTPDLQVNFDIGYTDFDEWNKLGFVFDKELSTLKIARLLTPYATTTSLDFPLNFKSTWSWGLGIEQRLSSRLVGRIGYEPRHSAVPLNQRNTMVPINGAQLFGTGLGYEFDADTTIDLTAAYLRSRDSIPADSSNLANKKGVNNLILNPYAGLNIKTKTDVMFLGFAYRTRW